MPLISGVAWEGLTKMALDFKETIPRNMSRTMAGWTRELGEESIRLYRENLRGSQPSTAEDPLPVGIRTGALLAGAELHLLNQWAWEIINAVPWAGWIEDGTQFMAPRRPLGDAVDVLEKKLGVEGAMDRVLTLVLEIPG